MASPHRRSQHVRPADLNGRAPSKRSRTAHACESCRTRKSRCDGGRPTCDVCAAIGLQCHYRGPARPALPVLKDDQILRIESRLQEMEKLLRSNMQQPMNQTSPVHCLATPEQAPDDRSMRADVLFGADESTFTSNASIIRSSPHGGLGDSDSVDGLALITFHDEGASAYFGESLPRCPSIAAVHGPG